MNEKSSVDENSMIIPEDPKLTKELIWVRSMLRVFSKLELRIHNELGANGIVKITLKDNYYILLLLTSFIIFIVGTVQFLITVKYYYLLSGLFPIGVVAFLFKQIKNDDGKNIFRFIGKTNNPPDRVLTLIEQFVRKERDDFEEIIAWQVSKYKNFPKEKFIYLFDANYWENLEGAQNQCVILAVLMVSLQKYLHRHKKYYIEYVKKLPIMNEIEEQG